MASITHSPTHSNTLPSAGVHTHFSAKLVCLGILVLSLVAAAIVVPLEWNLLHLMQQAPQWTALATWLAQAPLASWLMMFVWGTAVPVSLIVMLRHHRNVLGVLAAIGFALIAVAWYIHMPALATCVPTYGNTVLCNAISWGFSLSLSLANAVYLFALFFGILTGIGVATTQLDDNGHEV